MIPIDRGEGGISDFLLRGLRRCRHRNFYFHEKSTARKRRELAQRNKDRQTIFSRILRDEGRVYSIPISLWICSSDAPFVSGIMVMTQRSCSTIMPAKNEKT
jgi:hypothetical protein